MRKIVLLLLAICLLTGAAVAQPASRGQWCPAGATWKYAYQTTLLPPTTVVFNLRYSGDSTVNGQLCQKLSTAGSSVQLTRADADRVWQYWQGQFYKVYDFSAQPGDSWPYLFTYGSCTETTQIIVDSVGQRTLGGQVRRWFVAHYTVGGQLVRWGRIYEGVGPLDGGMYLFPRATRVGTCSMPPETPTQLGLRCFGTTAQPGLISVGSGCQAVPTAAHEARAVAAGLVVYPTAGSGRVTLQLPVAYTQATVSVLGTAGQLVWQAPAPAEVVLDLGRLTKGLYLIRAQAAGLPTLSQRIVLQ